MGSDSGGWQAQELAIYHVGCVRGSDTRGDAKSFFSSFSQCGWRGSLAWLAERLEEILASKRS